MDHGPAGMQTQLPFIKIVLGGTMIGLLAAVVVPNYVQSRTLRSQNTCLDQNLVALTEAKRRWSESSGAAATLVPTPDDLLPFLPQQRWPVCPLGGSYHLGPSTEAPRCSMANDHRN
jgi:hypothetical protein